MHGYLRTGGNAAVNDATNPALSAAMNDATNAANEAITQLFAQSPADAPPSAELIGRTAYRSAELTALPSVLKEVEAVVQRVFTLTENLFPGEILLPIFVNPPDWTNSKIRHLSSTDENIVHYWQP